MNDILVEIYAELGLIPKQDDPHRLFVIWPDDPVEAAYCISKELRRSY